LHYTALPDDKSITVLSQQAVSAHYLVNNTGDNEIYQLVDENKRSYHAGVARGEPIKTLMIHLLELRL
jgi:N-acetylmuramoyl-L-alanine amidase